MNQEKKFGSKLKRKIKANWKKLSDLDINEAGRSVKALSVKIQAVYGRDKKTVNQEFLQFQKLHNLKVVPVTSIKK